MTTCAFWSTAGFVMTGAVEGDAAAEPDGLGVAEAAGVVWSVSFLATLSAFLQADKVRAKRSGRIANLVSINAVRGFSWGRKNYKRFLDFLFAGRLAGRSANGAWRNLWRAFAFALRVPMRSLLSLLLIAAACLLLSSCGTGPELRV